MSDILIKNMEMPKDDEHGFILVFTKGLVVDFTNCKVIKAIELPPHGRCIDAVAFKGSIEGKILAGQGINIFSEIDNALTILEASTEETV